MDRWLLLPGGYLGVDIFFVISGYLITSLLITELSRTGRVSILKFYERRARRLLPALLVVMLASLPFAWRYLLPEQLVDFSKSVIFSLLFSSNFYWHFSLQEYGAESALLKPFLHTWSLAVEEQYYIAFPLFLFAIYTWCRRYLATLLSIGFAISLVFAQWMTGRDESFSFYMLPTRLWELLAGSLLAIAVLNHSPTVFKSPLYKALPSIGLLLILGSLIAFGYDVHHPGIITLIPVLGTVLIILFQRESDWVTRFLSKPLMVYLGLLSYSLYLWHYPIFAFARIADIAHTISQKAALIVVTLLVSAISYHLVEKPFRSKQISTKVLISTLSLASIVVVFTGLNWIKGDGVPGRGSYVQDLIAANRTKRVAQNGADCLSGQPGGRTFTISDSCVFEDFPGSPTLILLGDSHAASISGPMRTLASENHMNYVQITHIACPHLDISKWCNERSEALRSYLKKFDSPTIVYSARLPLYLEREPFENQESKSKPGIEFLRERKQLHEYYPDNLSNAVVETLTSLVDDGYRLVIVYPVPEQGFHVSTLLHSYHKSITSRDLLPTFATSYEIFKKRVASSYSALDKVQGPMVRRVYPEKIFCREKIGKCIASESDRIYFLVDNHVGALGADLISREVAAELGLEVPDSFRK